MNQRWIHLLLQIGQQAKKAWKVCVENKVQIRAEGIKSQPKAEVRNAGPIKRPQKATDMSDMGSQR